MCQSLSLFSALNYEKMTPLKWAVFTNSTPYTLIYPLICTYLFTHWGHVAQSGMTWVLWGCLAATSLCCLVYCTIFSILFLLPVYSDIIYIIIYTVYYNIQWCFSPCFVYSQTQQTVVNQLMCNWCLWILFQLMRTAIANNFYFVQYEGLNSKYSNDQWCHNMSLLLWGVWDCSWGLYSYIVSLHCSHNNN